MGKDNIRVSLITSSGQQIPVKTNEVRVNFTQEVGWTGKIVKIEDVVSFDSFETPVGIDVSEDEISDVVIRPRK